LQVTIKKMLNATLGTFLQLHA